MNVTRAFFFLSLPTRDAGNGRRRRKEREGGKGRRRRREKKP